MLNMPAHTHTHTHMKEKKVSLSKLKYLFHAMSAGEKREKPAEADSSHSLQALSPWRQRKDILFCFCQLPHSIQSDNKRARGGEKRCEQVFGMP